jgi:hypothetical protein
MLNIVRFPLKKSSDFKGGKTRTLISVPQVLFEARDRSVNKRSERIIDRRTPVICQFMRQYDDILVSVAVERLFAIIYICCGRLVSSPASATDALKTAAQW